MPNSTTVTRAASTSNNLLNLSQYEVPAYVYTAASISSSNLKLIADRDTDITFRVTNLANQRWSDPGFYGVDVPSFGFTGTLIVVQSL